MEESTNIMLKAIVLTVVTVGIYGSYWAMTQSFEENDFAEDETKKDADNVKRAVAVAMLSRTGMHV